PSPKYSGSKIQRLKQSGLLWNTAINTYLLSIGFTRSKLDPCLYVRRHEGKLSLLGLYVDDGLVVSEHEAHSDWVMSKLQQRFDIRDLSEANKCLGISIVRRDDGFVLHQRDSIQQLLTDMDMVDYKAAATPMDTTRYSIMRKAVGSLLWISNCTHPDITMAVNYFARFVA
ncbi:Retrovirus-related Pol Polyprotein, partial [Phytophthora palmivora]